MEIESSVDPWSWFIVGDLENYGMTDFQRVGRLFEVSSTIGCWIGFKKSTTICLKNRTYVGNT